MRFKILHSALCFTVFGNIILYVANIVSTFSIQANDISFQYFMGYDELLTRTLFLSVWHKSIGRNYFLGEVKIPMNNFVEAGNSLEQPVAKWYNLTDKVNSYDQGIISLYNICKHYQAKR